METTSSKQIYSSLEYDKFKFIEGNRAIDQQKVSAYSEMIEKGYSQDESPILVTSSYEILDGQHRYLAAKKCNTPIYYIVSNKNADSSAMLDINKNGNNWKLEDYVTLFAARGNQNYQKLKAFSSLYKVSFGICLICCGYNRRQLKKMITNELFVFNEEKAKEAEKWLHRYREFLGRCVMSGDKKLFQMVASFSFLEAVMTATNKKEDFFDSVFAARAILNHCSGFKGYLNQFISLGICE